MPAPDEKFLIQGASTVPSVPPSRRPTRSRRWRSAARPARSSWRTPRTRSTPTPSPAPPARPSRSGHRLRRLRQRRRTATRAPPPVPGRARRRPCRRARARTPTATVPTSSSVHPTPGEACGCTEPPDTFERPSPRSRATGTSPNSTTSSPPRASSPRRTPRAASTASTSRPPARRRATPRRLGRHLRLLGSGPVPGDYPAIGDYVEVTGQVSEFGGITEIIAAPSPTSWTSRNARRHAAERSVGRPRHRRRERDARGRAGAPPRTTSRSPTPSAPTRFGEIGLAEGDTPLIQPTEVADARTARADAVAADNAARAITLDDGASTDYVADQPPAPPRTPRCRGSRLTRSRAGRRRRDHRRRRWYWTTATTRGSSSRDHPVITASGRSVATFEDTRARDGTRRTSPATSSSRRSTC